ncbi:energy-coupled thiamine transporter ThiT [Halobacillus salinus]|uniref:Energy-coupled thiamine transporter ThiT n=1 Tax=Halobacillus salinus TaxID=192814 RepID=A0A4Z0H8F6_9BACI|nr:energy-coupled thiamine transporter ThiT [Halobacillus salinus]TGB05145.1 energy-coupled thiamine transporter ThiT [Halobacillus salinus]
MFHRRILFLVEVAIFAALALLLDVIPFLSFKVWAQGGSVSFSMVPVFLMAFRWGMKGGMTTGLLFGLYQIFAGAYIVTIMQTLLDYFIAFAAIGVSGIVSGPVQQAISAHRKKGWILWMTLGCFIGSVLRFAAHFLAGLIFYGSLAPPGQPVWLYSLVYNGGYMLPAFLLSTLVMILLLSKRPKLLLS